jgi:hypothetical protein
MKQVSASDEELTLFMYVTYLEMLYARDRMNELTDHTLRQLLFLLVELRDIAKRDMFYDVQVACMFLDVALKRRIGENNDEKSKQLLYKVIESLPKIEFEKQWPMYANFELAEVMLAGDHVDKKELVKVEKYLLSCKNFSCAADELFGTRIAVALRDVTKLK